MYIKYLPFQQCTAQASDMEAFLVSEHDRQALEIKVGVFDFPSVTMSGISDCLKGKLTFFCCFGETMSSMSMVLMTASLTFE